VDSAAKKLEELVGQAEIERAARDAQIHDALMARFPQGYDTVVGERGLKLSGGEKQRIAIARALLKDADIVLADEATSALDSMTEAEVVSKLRYATSSSSSSSSSSSKTPGEARPRTLVCVAHRLTTLKDCDRIFVLNAEGRLAEQGTHAELLTIPGGLYAQMWHKQQKQQKQQSQPGDQHQQPQPQPRAAAADEA
jgi:ABC-type multidrug transport system fused ATPase/permease subunit